MVKTRKDFQQLAAMRLEDAEALASSGKLNGAYYLGGVVVECALKACIAKKTNRHDFPADQKYAQSVYTHDLTQLVRLAGLEQDLETRSRANTRFAANWTVVRAWNINSRYDIAPLNGTEMVAAVSAAKDGVLKWIKRYW